MRLLVTIDLSGADIAAFEAYEAAVLPLIAVHGGRLEMRVRASDAWSETHLLHFPDEAAFEAYLADPVRQKARSIWEGCGARAEGVRVESLA
jgi:uncharacterized protein (DUF1330 family)